MHCWGARPPPRPPPPTPPPPQCTARPPPPHTHTHTHTRTHTHTHSHTHTHTHTPQSHNTCVTEHEKYALGATKPGGFAAQGFFEDKSAAPINGVGNGGGAAPGDGEAVGLEFLATSPPWRCNLCNVGATSRETLQTHATGTKHKRRVREGRGCGLRRGAASGGQLALAMHSSSVSSASGGSSAPTARVPLPTHHASTHRR
jgi:hypothetical protein